MGYRVRFGVASHLRLALPARASYEGLNGLYLHLILIIFLESQPFGRKLETKKRAAPQIIKQVVAGCYSGVYRGRTASGCIRSR